MSVIANRYIQALFSLPKSEEENKNLEKSLKEVAETFKTNEEFRKVLQDPRINSNVKVEIIKEIFKDNKQTSFIKFLALLIKEGRINCIQEIAEGYEQINSDRKKELKMKIIVASPIDEKQTKTIIEKFKMMYKAQTIEHEVIIDESLLGGVKIMVGNKIYDGSVATQLEQMF